MPEVRLVDPWSKADRVWASDEDAALVAQYREVRKVRACALALQLDQRQVAIRLVTLLLGGEGRIDNDDEMPNSGKWYSREEVELISGQYRAGVPLRQIALAVGRSQLGVGWRLLDLGLGATHPRG